MTSENIDTGPLQEILEGAVRHARPLASKGCLPEYLPLLASVPRDKMGIAVFTVDGRVYAAGDALSPFSIQSISKLFLLTLAMRQAPDMLWKRVGCEPSGQAFNSLAQLDEEKGVPRNPFINAGAILLCDVLESSSLNSPCDSMLAFLRMVSGNDAIQSAACVAQSELEQSDRHMAMAYLMRFFGNFKNDVSLVMQTYFKCCAIEMTCVDLAKACGYLANKGRCPATHTQVLNSQQTKQVNSLMTTCGLYNGAGEFSIRVGLPAKSGIGGGIVAVVPGEMTLCAYSPGLNETGNSLGGIAMLEYVTSALEGAVY